MESECDKLLKSLRHQSDARYMYFFIQPVYPPDYSAFISKPSEFALTCHAVRFLSSSNNMPVTLLQWTKTDFYLILSPSLLFLNKWLGMSAMRHYKTVSTRTSEN